MKCTRPVPLFRAAPGTLKSDGSPAFYSHTPQHPSDAPALYRSCSYCLSCRLSHAYGWQLRGVHELSVSTTDYAEFITLTYDENTNPIDLQYDDFQKFLKRMRGEFSFRYMAAAEYGEVCATCGLHRRSCSCDLYVPGPGRPHFHAILFNLNFSDRVVLKKRKHGLLYTSDTLSRFWRKGFAVTANADPFSIGYVARYTLKKKYGRQADDYYELSDPLTGEVIREARERMHASTRPPIGIPWLEKFYSDIYPRGYALLAGGKKIAPPRAYNNWIRKNMPDLWADTEAIGNASRLTIAPDYDRLDDRDFILQSRLNSNYRNDTNEN